MCCAQKCVQPKTSGQLFAVNRGFAKAPLSSTDGMSCTNVPHLNCNLVLKSMYLFLNQKYTTIHSSNIQYLPSRLVLPVTSNWSADIISPHWLSGQLSQISKFCKISAHAICRYSFGTMLTMHTSQHLQARASAVLMLPP